MTRAGFPSVPHWGWQWEASRDIWRYLNVPRSAGSAFLDGAVLPASGQGVSANQPVWRRTHMTKLASSMYRRYISHFGAWWYRYGGPEELIHFHKTMLHVETHEICTSLALKSCWFQALLSPPTTPTWCGISLQPGHTVDLFDEDCWWQGIVQEVFATRIKVLLTGMWFGVERWSCM